MKRRRRFVMRHESSHGMALAAPGLRADTWRVESARQLGDGDASGWMSRVQNSLAKNMHKGPVTWDKGVRMLYAKKVRWQHCCRLSQCHACG